MQRQIRREDTIHRSWLECPRSGNRVLEDEWGQGSRSSVTRNAGAGCPPREGDALELGPCVPSRLVDRWKIINKDSAGEITNQFNFESTS